MLFNRAADSPFGESVSLEPSSACRVRSTPASILFLALIFSSASSPPSIAGNTRYRFSPRSRRQRLWRSIEDTLTFLVWFQNIPPKPFFFFPPPSRPNTASSQTAIGGSRGPFEHHLQLDNHGVGRWITCIPRLCGMDGLTEN